MGEEDWVSAPPFCSSHFVDYLHWLKTTFFDPGPRNDHCPVPNLYTKKKSWAFDSHSLLSFAIFRFFEHLFHCEIFWILDGMSVVWVIFSINQDAGSVESMNRKQITECFSLFFFTIHWIFCINRTWTFTVFKNFWILSTNLILFRRLQWQIALLLLFVDGK